MTEKITWNDPGLVLPNDNQLVLVVIKNNGVYPAVFYENYKYNWIAATTISVFQQDYTEAVPNDRVTAWAEYPKGPPNLSKLSPIDAAWAALEAAGFTRGKEFTDDDVLGFLQNACNSEK